MPYFERDDVVSIRTAAESVVEAQVVLDTGDDTIVVTRNDNPTHAKRIHRSLVSKVSGSSRPKPTRPPAPKLTPVSPTELKCLQTEHGWCALMMQYRPTTQAERIEGVWSICGTWMQSPAKPVVREPSCRLCRQRLKLGDDG